MTCALDRCKLSASLINTCGSCGRVVCDLHYFAPVGLCEDCGDKAEALADPSGGGQ